MKGLSSNNVYLEPTKFVILLRILDLVDQNLSKFDDFGVFGKLRLRSIQIDDQILVNDAKFPNFVKIQISKFTKIANFIKFQILQNSNFDKKSKFRHGGLL